MTLSAATPEAREASPLIDLAGAGALSLAAGVLTLGVGLMRAARAPA